MSKGKDLFKNLNPAPPLAGLDLSLVSDVGPPPVAPEALKAAQVNGEAKGFRARGGGPALVRPIPDLPEPSPAPSGGQRPPSRVRVREMRAAEPEIGRGMQKASFTALVPVDIMERFMALEGSTGAKRWHLLTLALQVLEQQQEAGTLKGEVKSALRDWAAAVEQQDA